MTSEVCVQLSREIALALPMIRMVVFVQRDMRIEWLIEAWISIILPGLSKFSTNHLLPSSSFREGFLVLMLSGFGFLLGTLRDED